MSGSKTHDKKSVPLALTTSDHVQKNGDFLGVWNNTMDFDSNLIPFHGIYWKGMRYLSSLVLLVDDASPLPLSSSLSSLDEKGSSPYFRQIRLLGPPISRFTRDSSNPKLMIDGPLLIDRKRFCFPSGMTEEITIHNHGPFPIRVPVSLKISADFRDIMDIRGIRNPWPDHSIQIFCKETESLLILACECLDHLFRKTTIQLHPLQIQWNQNVLEGTMDIPAHSKDTLRIKVQCEEAGSLERIPIEQVKRKRAGSVAGYLNQDQRSQEHYRSMWPTITGARLPLSRWRDNAINDLRILMTPTKFGQFPYAGIPWFSTPFGRDALITGFSTLWAYPPLTRSVLLFLSATQAKKNDPFRDAEIGKILHEFRYGEAGADPTVPFGRYYGSVDAPALFISLAWEYLRRTGDKNTLKRIRKPLLLAMEWIEKKGVDPQSGFLVYKADRGKGLIQKGWKDSGDSIFHANGELATGPIALSEVQGYLFMAYQSYSKLSDFFGDSETALYFEKKSVALQHRFHQAFWSDKIHMFSLALDGSGDRCEVRSSNAGHLLFTGIAFEKHAQKTVKELLKPDMFSGWGIRTLGNKEIRYNPVSYHNGSIWPHDNGLILAGISKYGFKDELSVLAESYFQALSALPSERPPELFCGFERTSDSDGPLSYPTSCRIQAWSVASYFLVIQAIASLDFDGQSKHGIDHYSSCIPSLGSMKIETVLHPLPMEPHN